MLAKFLFFLVFYACPAVANTAGTPSRSNPPAQWSAGDNLTLVHGASAPGTTLFGVTASAQECGAACRKANASCVGWTWQDTTQTNCKGVHNPNQPLDCWHFSGSYLAPTQCPGHVSGWLSIPPTYPTPTPRQLQWMQGADPIVGGLSQFMHFGISTFWVEGDK